MIIANNPSMYAFLLAKNFDQIENVRVVSIGVGAYNPIKIDPLNSNILYWYQNIEDLFINTEITTHVFMTKLLSERYHRFEVYASDLSIEDLEIDTIQYL